MALLSLALRCHLGNRLEVRCMVEWDLFSRITQWAAMGLRVANMAHKVTKGNQVMVAYPMPTTQALAWEDL